MLFSLLFSNIFPIGYFEEFKTIGFSSIPIVLGIISQIFIPIVGVLFCGQIGPEELDGVSLSSTVDSF